MTCQYPLYQRERIQRECFRISGGARKRFWRWLMHGAVGY
jgi:hypothetical protein